MITVPEATWKESADTLYDWAYAKYSENITDEKHFLIVYSVPETETEDSWKGYEYIQGSKTGRLGSTKRCLDTFTFRLNTGLQSPSTSTNSALYYAFQYSADVMKQGNRFDNVGLTIVIYILVFIFHAYLFYLFSRVELSKKRIKDAVPCDYMAKEVYCPACGAVFVEGTVETCTYCQGELKPVETKEPPKWLES